MTNNNQTAPVSDEELDQMILKLERDGMTPKQLSLMRELREVRRARDEPVVWTWQHLEQWHVTNNEERARDLAWDGVKVIPLYTAPPAPVVDDDDNFYSWFGREWHEHYQQNQYTTAAKQMLGVMAESAWKAGRAAMLQADGTLTNEDAMQLSGNSEQLEPVSNRDELPTQSSNEVNDAAWKLYDMLTEHGPLNGYQFNNLKDCFYEALKVAMRQAAPNEVKGE
jgi:hypothetical protein